MSDVDKFLTPNISLDPTVALVGSRAQQAAANPQTQGNPAQQAFGVEYYTPMAIRYEQPFVPTGEQNTTTASTSTTTTGGGSGGTTSPMVTMSGTIITVGVTVGTVPMVVIPTGNALYVGVTVVARNSGGTDFGGFIRNATIKNVAGVLANQGLSQDLYAQCSQSTWEVYFAFMGTTVEVAFSGQLATTISWTYVINYMLTA